MPTEIELLTGKKKSIKINGRVFKIGKFSLNQTLRFIDVIMQFCIGGATKFQKLKIDGKSNFADALAIMSLLPEEQAAELIAVFLNTADIKFCISISAEDISEIVLEICEQNDIGKIVKNFSRAFEIVKNQIRKKSKN